MNWFVNLIHQTRRNYGTDMHNHRTKRTAKRIDLGSIRSDLSGNLWAQAVPHQP